MPVLRPQYHPNYYGAFVGDYDAALEFYHAAVGAHVLFDAPSPLGGRYLHVGFGEPVAVFYTPDVDAAVARVEGAGGTTVRRVETAGEARFAHVADLYGNVFVIVELVNGGS